MEINLLPACQIQRVEYKKQKPKQVSFGSSDEFIKTATEKTFKEAKKEIQQKYQPTISALRKKETNQLRDLSSSFNKIICYRNDFTDYLEEELVSKFESYKKGDIPLDDEIIFQKNFSMFKDRLFAQFDTRDWNTPLKGVLVSSKDEKLSEKFIDFLRFYHESSFYPPSPRSDEIKMRKYLKNGAGCLSDWVTVNDTTGDKGDLIESIYNAMEHSESRYKKIRRKSIIQVENMEKLIRADENTQSKIAIIKNYLSNSHNATYIFSCTEPEKAAPGVLWSHRIQATFNLDELEDPAGLIEKLNQKGSKDIFQPEIDKVRKLCEEYEQTQIEIEKIQAQCKREVAQAKKTLPKGSNVKRPTPPAPPAPTPGGGDDPNRFKELINKAIKKVKENKKAAIIIGAVAVALTATGIILHKKGKLKKQRVAMPQAQQPLKTAQFQNFMQGDSNVFKDFTLSNK